MGTDIHIYFEKKVEDKWVCYPFVPKLAKDEWFDSLLYKKESRELLLTKGLIAFGYHNSEDEILEKLEKYYTGLPLEEAEKLFKDNIHCYRDWGIPYALRSRDYSFFAALSGIRGKPRDNKLICENEGIPADVCWEIKREYMHNEGDGHTHGWIMLDELFDKAINFRSVNEIKNYMEKINETDYSSIRMVFWYDN